MENKIKNAWLALGVCMVMGLASCENTVMDGDLGSAKHTGAARLTMITRNSDGDADGVKQGRIYIFSEAGMCLRMLTTDEEAGTATAHLAPGTYTVCALGGDNLSCFALPAQSVATMTSVVSPKDAGTMSDLLVQSVGITLEEGQLLDREITLERKVVCVKDIEIKEVPEDVTKVEVSVWPFSSGVCLNGTYPTADKMSWTIELEKQEDGTTWKASPQQLLFPSAGTPTVNMSLTSAAGTTDYSYTAEEPFAANHHYSLTATYKPAVAQMAATLKAMAWGEEKAITFNFNETNMVYRPVAGQYCNGYYVVSVNEEAHTAVLLSQKVPYDAPAAGATNAEWRAALNASMEALERPTNITGSWRLPTFDEAEIFTADANAVTYGSTGVSVVCFCEDNGEVKWAYTQRNGDSEPYTYTFKKGGTSLNSAIRLRPVIDITYE